MEKNDKFDLVVAGGFLIPTNELNLRKYTLNGHSTSPLADMAFRILFFSQEAGYYRKVSDSELFRRYMNELGGSRADIVASYCLEHGIIAYQAGLAGLCVRGLLTLERHDHRSSYYGPTPQLVELLLSGMLEA